MRRPTSTRRRTDRELPRAPRPAPGAREMRGGARAALTRRRGLSSSRPTRWSRVGRRVLPKAETRRGGATASTCSRDGRTASTRRSASSRPPDGARAARRDAGAVQAPVASPRSRPIWPRANGAARPAATPSRASRAAFVLSLVGSYGRRRPAAATRRSALLDGEGYPVRGRLGAGEGGHDARLQPKPCPICGRRREPRCAPFCSARCADVDLGRWLTGSYAIPVPTRDEDADEPTIRRPTSAGQRRTRSYKRRSPGSRPRGAQVAQLVEHATENRSVGGSIPPLGTINPLTTATS